MVEIRDCVPGLLKYSNPLPFEAPVKLLSGSNPSILVHKNKFLAVRPISNFSSPTLDIKLSLKL